MIRRLLHTLLFLASGAMWGSAQEIISGQPLIGSTATVVPDQPAADDSQDNVFHILVIGDTIGGGLGAGLTRAVEQEDGYDVTLRFNEESGVARPEVYDWGETIPKIVADKGYDGAVILLGANDRQTIRQDSVSYDFNTPGWIIAYKSRMDRILDGLVAAGIKIYWVSLPPMGDPAYNQDIKIVAAIQKERVEAKGGQFIDISKNFLDASGQYTDQGPDDTGEIHKLRGRDGVSFFKAGNNLMAQLVLNAIRASLAAPAKPAPAPVISREQPVLPLFGQYDYAGAEATFTPEPFTSQSLAGAGAMGIANVRSIVAPGSAAEKLFVTGEAAPAPVGRADDYKLPE
jgi:hypothetical protein